MKVTQLPPWTPGGREMEGEKKKREREGEKKKRERKRKTEIARKIEEIEYEWRLHNRHPEHPVTKNANQNLCEEWLTLLSVCVCITDCVYYMSECVCVRLLLNVCHIGCVWLCISICVYFCMCVSVYISMCVCMSICIPLYVCVCHFVYYLLYEPL